MQYHTIAQTLLRKYAHEGVTRLCGISRNKGTPQGTLGILVLK